MTSYALAILITILLVLTGSFILWYYIYARKETLKESVKSGKIMRLIFSAVLAVLTVLTIAFDFHRALTALEQYGDEQMLHLMFYPVSALAAVFIMIPSAVRSSRRDPVVPEEGAILSVYLFTLTINFLCGSVIHEHSYLSSSLCYLTVGILSSLIAVLTPLISQDRYNKELMLIDKKLSDSRNSHYEAMMKSNFELRRVRHDMKNHLLAVRNLAENSDREGLLGYLDSISEEIDNTAPPYRSGNDIADAIIADKRSKASKRGLELAITGDLAGLNIEAADLVTILSNLLDNAIEAVSRLYGNDLTSENKRIELEFLKNSNFIFMVERNMSAEKVNTVVFKSSKNSPDHGFGIYNIRRSVRKYGGEYNMNCSEYGGLYKVEVEIILPLADKIR